MKEKKIIFIIIITLLLTTITCLFLISCSTNDKNNTIKESNSNIENISVSLEEQYVVEKDSIPSIEMFTSIEGASMKIYYNGEEISGPLNNSGEYEVIITINNKEYKTKLIVEDNPPVLLLKEVSISEGDTYRANDFVDKVEGTADYSISFTEEKMGTFTESGTYDISIKLTYNNDKVVVNNTKLIINEKTTTSNSNKTSNKNYNAISNSNKNSNNASNSNKTSNKNSNTSNKNSNITLNKNSNSNITSNSNNNTSNSNSNSNNSNSNAPVTVVKTENKTDVTTQNKYGAKLITTTKYTLITYSDGSTKKSNSSSSITLDSSGFTTSTSAMLSEATSISKSTLSERQQVTNYTNQYRKEKDENLNILVLDEKLSIAATIRAMELAYTEYKYKHYRPNGESYYTAIKEVYGSSTYTGENIAYASGGIYDTPKEISEGWKSSTSHYNTMTDENFTKIGVGHVTLLGKDYWVQLFVK